MLLSPLKLGFFDSARILIFAAVYFWQLAKMLKQNIVSQFSLTNGFINIWEEHFNDFPALVWVVECLIPFWN